ncbi:hypothetical protein [Ascidiaceihabitans sp.]|uniref:hypothetical protein n=1 Tax=Ascidiaceihabitans sp. TaxID=1872644 RepID=UPI00329727E8
MAELHDASKPAGHLIKVREDGSALRNDGGGVDASGAEPVVCAGDGVCGIR